MSEAHGERSKNRLAIERADTMLLIVDVQEKLMPAMHPELSGPLVANLRRVLFARAALELPLVVTEQYPKGLGPTIASLTDAMGDVPRLAKMHFSAVADADARAAIEATNKGTVMVAGVECHVCVFQTVRDLVLTHRVFVLSDAVASRTRENCEVGLRLMERAGAIVTSTEAVLFDLVGRAGTDAFRVVSALVRDVGSSLRTGSQT